MGSPAGGDGVPLALSGQAGRDADQDRPQRPDDDRQHRHPLRYPPARRRHKVDLRSAIAYSAPSTAVIAASRKASAVPWAKSAWAKVVLETWIRLERVFSAVPFGT